MTFRPFAAAATITLALFGVVQTAQAKTWHFKDWSITANPNPATNQMDCRAWTRDGKENYVFLDHQQGSEFAYPTVTFVHYELLDRHEPLVWQDAKLLFRFDGSGDLGGIVESETPTVVDGRETTAYEGYPYNNERAMTWMAQGNRFSAVLADYPDIQVFDVSLSGFVASFLKIVEQCGAERDGIF